MLPTVTRVIISRTFPIFAFVVSLSTSLYPQQTAPRANDSDFVSLFNGKTLDGWRGDAPYWSVRDGAILGEITEQTRINANRFLIYEGEIPADFEFVAGCHCWLAQQCLDQRP